MHFFQGPLLPKPFLKPTGAEGEFPGHDSLEKKTEDTSGIIPHARRLHEVLRAAKAFAEAGGGVGTPEWNRLQAAVQEAYGTPEPETPPRAVRPTPVPDTEEDEEPCPPTPRSNQYVRHLREVPRVVPTFCGQTVGVTMTVSDPASCNCGPCLKEHEKREAMATWDYDS